MFGNETGHLLIRYTIAAREHATSGCEGHEKSTLELVAGRLFVLYPVFAPREKVPIPEITG